MCPFCISTVVSVAAGTIATAGVGALFAFARRVPEPPDAVIRENTPASLDDRA
jgi:hypothetical protein